MIDVIDPDDEKKPLEDLLNVRNLLREEISDLEDELEMKTDEYSTPNRSTEQWEGCPVDDWDDEMREWTDHINEIKRDLNEARQELQDLSDEIEDRESSEE